MAQHSVEFNPARKVSVSPFPQGSAVNMSPSDPKNLPLFSPIRNFYASCSSFSPIRNLSASSCCCCSPLLSFARSPAVSLIHRSIHGGEAFQVRDPRRRCCCCKIRTSIHRFLPFFLKWFICFSFPLIELSFVFDSRFRVQVRFLCADLLIFEVVRLFVLICGNISSESWFDSVCLVSDPTFMLFFGFFFF